MIERAKGLFVPVKSGSLNVNIDCFLASVTGMV
jgi:hypothetical protein